MIKKSTRPSRGKKLSGSNIKHASTQKAAVHFSITATGQLEAEPSNQEVEKILQMANSNKFVPGIYNYCDRWCKKCSDTEKCFLFAQDALEKIKEGPKKNGRSRDMAEVQYKLKTAEKAIQAVIKKDGCSYDETDLKAVDSAWDKDAIKRYNKYFCLKNSREYFKEAHKFLKNYYDAQEEYLKNLNLRVNQDDIRDEIETIGWYHSLLPTKIWRVLYEREASERETDLELRVLVREGMVKYLKLVETIFSRSKIAISSLADKRDAYIKISCELLCKLKRTELSFREEFKLSQGYNILGPEFDDEQVEIMKNFEENPTAGLQRAQSYLLNNPDMSSIYGIVGDMQINFGKFNDAVNYLEVGARMSPNDAILFFLWGVALAKTGRFNEALIRLNRASKLEPGDLEIKRNIGWVTAMRGRFRNDRSEIDRGREIMIDVIKETPDNVLTMADLGQSYLMTQEFETAFRWMDRARRLEPENKFIEMIYNDIIQMKRQYQKDPKFREMVKKKAETAYSGPKAKDDEDMDEQIAKQFEVEAMIGDLNNGDLNKDEAANIMKRLEESGMVGQVTSISDPKSPSAKIAAEYIEAHRRIPNVEKKISPKKVKELIKELNTKKLKKEEQKKIILILAHQGTKEALTTLKKIHKKTKGELLIWLKLAIDECRAFLDSDGKKPGIFFSKL